MLARDGDLTPCQEIMALDKVETAALDAGEEKLLKAKGLIEGKPNYFGPVVSWYGKPDRKRALTAKLAFDKQYYLT